MKPFPPHSLYTEKQSKGISENYLVIELGYFPTCVRGTKSLLEISTRSFCGPFVETFSFFPIFVGRVDC